MVQFGGFQYQYLRNYWINLKQKLNLKLKFKMIQFGGV